MRSLQLERRRILCLSIAIFIDSFVDKVRLTDVGCYISHVCVSIFLYADDILLIAPSVSALQILLSVCEDEFRTLDTQLNTKKSTCIRFGERHKVSCAGLVSSSGGVINWKNTYAYILSADVCLVAPLIMPKVDISGLLTLY